MSLTGDPSNKPIPSGPGKDAPKTADSAPAKSSASGQSGMLIVQDDTVIKGDIRNCRQIEVYGYVEGDLEAEKLLVHKDGKFFGTVKTDSADIDGTLQGRIFVKNLINIRSSGTVIGNVQYGQMAMENGGNLSAEVRNVPPTLAGDFNIAVEKGKSAPVTTWDLTAFDPDDEAKDLTYSVSNAVNGFVALSSAPSKPVDRFTQADLEAGKLLFQHDGKNTAQASFDVVVTDAKGGSSGQAQTVTVDIKSAQ